MKGSIYQEGESARKTGGVNSQDIQKLIEAKEKNGRVG